MLRFLDVSFAVFGLLLGSPFLLVIYAMGLFDTGSPLLFQIRLGRYKKPFLLVKFRTMRIDTVSVASHLADVSAITKWGNFLRRTKLDELPQLWNVLKGEMSLVGPRPGLPNQLELTKERDSRGVFSVRPGITGLAQINNIDMSDPAKLATVDKQMIDTFNAINYLRYIILTVLGKGSGDAIRE